MFLSEALAGLSLEEAGERVSLHQPVHLSQRLVETAATRARDGPLDLLSDIVVDVDLWMKPTRDHLDEENE